ncbi:hypothetical protein [Pseudooceanicola atlanticus]|uniref:Uncharacterized protein n=1 Tax=Pseudooceanicola atlanticus TaxID=1461694 RepID=A0A0A0EFR5_9RHOB|nr:hypothetical protein [Pseudooceanicola atlanticus]KGM48918.1 hypothetical protein ATO9_09455 [Pseudooceanicola atlanticus]
MIRVALMSLALVWGCRVDAPEPDRSTWDKLAAAMNLTTPPEKASWVVEQSNCLIKMHRTVIGKCDSGDVRLYYEKNIDQSEVKEVKIKSHDGITMISFYFKEDIARVLVRASEVQSARGGYSYLRQHPIHQRNNMALEILNQANVKSFGFANTCQSSDLVYLDYGRVNILANSDLFDEVRDEIAISMRSCAGGG